MPDDPMIGVDDRALDDAALEALAEAAAAAPPPGLRAHVLRTALLQRQLKSSRRRERVWLFAAAASVLGAVAVGGLFASERQDTRALTASLAALEETHERLGAKVGDLEATLEAVHEMLLDQSDVMRVMAQPQLRSAELAPQPGASGRGRVLLDPSGGDVALVVAGLPTPDPGLVYELWAIRGDRAPEPVGLFVPESGRSHAVNLGSLPQPGEITAFAVSIEPEGGSQSPTGPIVLVGAVPTGS